MTKKLFLLFSLLILISIFGCNKECKHEFLEATCVNKEKCIKCGLEQGFPLGHYFLEATTDKPMTCKRCGITSGEPIKKHEHKFLEPTCILPKRCECGYEEGEALGHIEKTIFPDDAECLIPVMAMIKCERCHVVLEEKEIEYIDCGTFNEENVNYPEIAKAVALEMEDKECNKGIVICRSGIGMSIVANKFKGIRCAKCNDEEEAKFSRMHNDANMLALGADYIDTNKAIRIVRMWIATEFQGGRHEERIKMIEEIENENMK